ncbi:hypothetical protein V2J09_001315 [Rumex salicifolius]
MGKQTKASSATLALDGPRRLLHPRNLLLLWGKTSKPSSWENRNLKEALKTTIALVMVTSFATFLRSYSISTSITTQQRRFGTSLKKRYKAVDEGKKQYITSKWTSFQMKDDLPILDQLHDYEAIVSKI